MAEPREVIFRLDYVDTGKTPQSQWMPNGDLPPGTSSAIWLLDWATKAAAGGAVPATIEIVIRVPDGTPPAQIVQHERRPRRNAL